jgi:hypothetical protein
MAISLLEAPQPFCLLKNRQRIVGNTDLPLYSGGVKAKVAFAIATEGFEDQAQFSLVCAPQSKVYEYYAVDGPSGPGEFPYHNIAEMTRDEYINDIFIPLLQGIPFIVENYNIILTTTLGVRIITIEAKDYGAKWALEVDVLNSENVTFSNYAEAEDRIYNNDLTIVCDVYRRTTDSNSDEDWTLIDRLREYPSPDGSFTFYVEDTCRLTIEPGLTVNYIPEHHMNPDNRPAHMFRFIVYEDDPTPEMETAPVSQIRSTAGFYGGLFEPIYRPDLTEYYAKFPRKLLTNAPRILTVPVDFAFCISATHIHTAPAVTVPIFNIRAYDREGEIISTLSEGADRPNPVPIFGDQSPDALYIFGLMRRREEQLHQLAEFPAKYELWFSDIDGNGSETGTNITEKLTLLIDPRRHHEVNYFIFQNAFGMTEICWTYGPAEISNSPEGDNYLRHRHTTTFQQYGGNAGSIMETSISTGLKPVAEIQWMLEMLNSPVVYWIRRPGLRQWQQDENALPNSLLNRAYLQPIVIAKDSIAFARPQDGLQQFTFKFTTAHLSPAPMRLL